MAIGKIFSRCWYFCGCVLSEYLRLLLTSAHFFSILRPFSFLSFFSWFRSTSLTSLYNSHIVNIQRWINHLDIFGLVWFSGFNKNPYDQLCNVKWSARFDSIQMVHWFFSAAVVVLHMKWESEINEREWNKKHVHEQQFY